MPTARIVRRGKRRSPVRVTLISRRWRLCTHFGRNTYGHTLNVLNANSKRPLRKKTCITRSVPSGSSRMKKKFPQTQETHQMPSPLFRVDFHSEEMETISAIVQSLSGEATIPHLLDTLTARGFERNSALDKVKQLVDARRVLVDSEGYICWTYNPVLAAHYRSHPELQIR